MWWPKPDRVPTRRLESGDVGSGRGIIVKYAPEALKLTPNLLVGTVNMRFIPSYLMTVIGVGVMMYGFAKAYRASQAVPIQPAELSRAA